MANFKTLLNRVLHEDRDVIARLGCSHEFVYDAAESAGPWTGYIERCSKCGALQQIPQ